MVEFNHIGLNITTSLSNIANDFNDDIFSKISIYFPDEGSYKRYKKYFKSGIVRYCVYGKKVRDWKTGQILGLEIYNENGEKVTEKDIKDKIFLMIDDIVSYGGTMAYGSDKLKELGAKEVYAYASHTENSILDKEKGTLLKRIENGTVKKLFTTNSIYSGTNKNIELVYEY
jgi:ribose-phosphate pyrophosphokinase